MYKWKEENRFDCERDLDDGMQMQCTFDLSERVISRTAIQRQHR